jgi:hypothetical protein
MPRHPPLRSQRWVVLIGLATFVVILHTTFCEWRFWGELPPNVDLAERILAHTHDYIASQGGGRTTRAVVTGLYAQRTVSRELAIVCGICVPILLIGTALYLNLGWRYTDRIARGLCPRCRYDLRGDREAPQRKCPECGWARDDEPP